MGDSDSKAHDDAHRVSFNAHGVPVSSVFDDAYFAYQNGLEETKEVFLGGNKLVQRWSSGGCNCIGELGFGTGLNFIATLQAWRDRPDASDEEGSRRRLHYVAFERFPMEEADVRRALAPWPELADLIDEILEFDPPVIGINERALPDVDLELHVGDARELVCEITCEVDAWYLDGFSPKRNPELWGQQLMTDVFAKTAPGGTFSTYTAAGWVRRNLEGVGFEVSRVPGFGTKRERLQGTRPKLSSAK